MLEVYNEALRDLLQSEAAKPLDVSPPRPPACSLACPVRVFVAFSRLKQSTRVQNQLGAEVIVNCVCSMLVWRHGGTRRCLPWAPASWWLARSACPA